MVCTRPKVTVRVRPTSLRAEAVWVIEPGVAAEDKFATKLSKPATVTYRYSQWCTSFVYFQNVR